MTQATSAEAFYEYVRAQDPERTINHNTWHSCAVGDWVRESKDMPNIAWFDEGLNEYAGCIDSLQDVQISEDENLYDVLNEASSTASQYELNTYGQMQEFLGDLGV